MLNLKFQNLLSITKLVFVFTVIASLCNSQNQKIDRLALQYQFFNSASEKEKSELNLAIANKFLNEGDYEIAVSLNAKVVDTQENHDVKYFISGKAEFLVDNNEGSLSFLNGVNEKKIGAENNKELQLYKILNYNHLFYIDSTINYLSKLYLNAGKDTSGMLQEIKALSPPKFFSLKKARRKSAIFPGAGLWYVGERKRGFTSALINLASLGYIAYSIYTKYYVTAVLTGGSQFMRFYAGGKKASVKIGNKKNREKFIIYALKLDEYCEKKFLAL